MYSRPLRQLQTSSHHQIVSERCIQTKAASAVIGMESDESCCSVHSQAVAELQLIMRQRIRSKNLETAYQSSAPLAAVPLAVAVNISAMLAEAMVWYELLCDERYLCY